MVMMMRMMVLVVMLQMLMEILVAMRVMVVVQVLMNGDDDASVNESVLSHFCFESVFYSPGSSLVSFPNPLSLVPSEAENLSWSSPILFVMDLPFL